MSARNPNSGRKKPISAILILTTTLCLQILGHFGCAPSMETVQATTDQAKLARFAVEAQDKQVCLAAVERLTDQALLAKVAVEPLDRQVCLAAVERLTDQALLAKVASEGLVFVKEDWWRRQAAFERLTDQAVLAKVAVDAEDWRCRRAALEKLTDQAVLAKVAVDTRDWRDRCAVVEKATDQAVLAQIADGRKQSMQASPIYAQIDEIVQAVLPQMNFAKNLEGSFVIPSIVVSADTPRTDRFLHPIIVKSRNASYGSALIQGEGLNPYPPDYWEKIPEVARDRLQIFSTPIPPHYLFAFVPKRGVCVTPNDYLGEPLHRRIDPKGTRSVIFSRRERKEAGSYGVLGAKAFSVTRSVCVISWPERKLVAATTVVAWPPPRISTTANPITVVEKDAAHQIEDWLRKQCSDCQLVMDNL